MTPESASARIGPVDPSQLSAEQQRVFDSIAGTRGRVAGPFAVLLHAPELADRIQRLGAYLRYEGALDRQLAELAILVTAAVWSSELEWVAHEPIAREAGLSDEAIDGIRAAAWPPDVGDLQAAVYEYARELATSGTVTDPVYARVRGLLGTEQTVELTVVVGYYSMLAMTLNAHGIKPAP